MKNSSIIIAALFLSIISLSAQTVELPKFFSSGMVLQRETTVPFWGWATAGTEIVIRTSWDGNKITTTTDNFGKWMVHLKTPQAGGPYTIGVNQTSISNVMIGEVWVCSGQSNMKMRLGEADSWNVSNDNNSNIRVFEVSQTRSNTPQKDVSGGTWRYGVINDNMQHISAVGYYFARKLQEELQVPVGMIGIYEGGTAAEEWISPTVFSGLPSDIKSAYGTPSGREAGCLYNAMVNPLLPYRISGFIWYQGENNVGHQQTYNSLMKALVDGWRKDFKDDFLPFYIVQLTTFSSDWAEFRNIQQKLSDELSNSGLAVTIDVGDQGDIHPKTKFPVGNRLADIALAKVYGKDKTYASPTYRSHQVEGNNLRIFFDHAEKGLKITSGEYPLFFEIAGSDNAYHPANAKIEGNTILLWSDKVESPVKARYFWKSYAVPNVFSTDDYPLAPFVSE